MSDPEHVDCLIIGCGLSGVCAAGHLIRECPELSWLILESRAELGGTWSLFQYPGVRSDSHMCNMAYDFKPWTKPKVMASGAEILEYITSVHTEYGMASKTRFNTKVASLDWSSTAQHWNVTTTTGATLTAGFVFSGVGYYKYDEAYTPDFPNREVFKGEVIHPQFWPKHYNYEDKTVVVIGSGATAVTLIPAMAEMTKHITMLQRSPTYIADFPEDPGFVYKLVRFFFGDNRPDWAHSLVRAYAIYIETYLYHWVKNNAEAGRTFLMDGVKKALGVDSDPEAAKKFNEKDWTPKYAPWDERLCAAPDGDFFKVVRAGRASVVTAEIETFTPEGIMVRREGETAPYLLPADVIITATGLAANFGIGAYEFSVDGKPVDVADNVMYKGMFLSGVPNLIFMTGYTNASWTLKVNLCVRYVCRLFKFMQSNNMAVCVAPKPADVGTTEPVVTNLKSGYIRRGAHNMPRQGKMAPWMLHQNFRQDERELKNCKLDDGFMKFTKRI